MPLSFELFHRLLKVTPFDGQHLTMYILEHPLLLSNTTIEAVYSDINSFPHQYPDQAIAVLKFLVKLQQDLGQDLNSYPFGAGPVEELYQKVKKGEISLDVACETAMQSGLYQQLSPLYVKGITNVTEVFIRDNPENWERSINFMKVLLATLEGAPDSVRREKEYGFMFRYTVETWVGVVSRALRYISDAHLFHSALDYGEGLVQQLKESDKPEQAFLILFRLGLMHSDPYFVGRRLENYDYELKSWYNTVSKYRSYNLTDKKMLAVPEMPAPATALNTSIEYLLLAEKWAEGASKAKVFKALAQNYQIKEELFKIDATDTIRHYCEEGIRWFIPEAEYQEERLVLLNMMQNYFPQQPISDQGPDIAVAHFLLEHDDGEILDTYLLSGTTETFNQIIIFYLKHDLLLTKALWSRYNAFIGSGSGRINDQYFTLGIKVLQACYFDPYLKEANQLPVEKLIALIEERGMQGELPEFGALTGLVVASMKYIHQNQEATAMLLLDNVLEQSAGYEELDDFIPCIWWLKAQAEIGEAVNQFDNGDIPAAADHYLWALAVFIDINLPEHLIDLLERLSDLVVTGTENSLIVIVGGVSTYQLGIEKTGKIRARELCQDIYRFAMESIVKLQIQNAMLIAILFQYAKGFSFGVSLGNTERGMPLSDQTKEILADIQSLEEGLKSTGHETSARFGQWEEEMLLSSYIGDRQKFSGNTDRERLDNLKMEFDALINSDQLDRVSQHSSFLFTVEQIQASLQPYDVLLVQYLGCAPGGAAAIFTLLFTREQLSLVHGVMQGYPSGFVRMEGAWEGLSISVPISTFLTGKTRREIMADPYKRVVSIYGQKLLQEDSMQYLGGTIKENLAENHLAGKDHLIIVPHGGLHFYPYHLLPTGNSILADEWKVTYLPNLKLLDRSLFTEAAASSRNPIAVFGLSFPAGNTHQLRTLERAIPEALQIAAIFDTLPSVNEFATVEAFREALQGSRMVHLCTHGAHNVIAPMFQCLYLHPDLASDGILHAYELDGADLRGLDLITLSACETALGRIDPADNLRGLPATLLSAGVATIIGTLWEAEDAACEIFFVSLYKALKNGAKKFEAFYTAQQDTRMVYPAYRQWGAFYLTGQSE